MTSADGARRRAEQAAAIKERLAEVVGEAPSDETVSVLQEYVNELRSQTEPSSRTMPVQEVIRNAASTFAYQRTLHELRSLILAINCNVDVARRLMMELLQRLNSPNDGDIRRIVDLQDALDDTIAAANHAVVVARDGLDAIGEPRAEHARLRDCVTLVARLMSRGRGKITPPQAELIPNVEVRPSRGEVMQVLINIIRNAQESIENQTDGRVELSGWASSTMAFVRISDNGRDASKILDSGTSGNWNFQSQKPDGAGVGLLVCRELVERWGGTLQVAANPSSGMSFTLGIPVR